MKSTKMTNDFKHFIDKEKITLPQSHRFYELSQKFADYHGVDILSFTDDNELLTGLARDKAIKDYENLLNVHALPQACVLIVITDEPNPRLLLTRRSSHLTSHAGEVSLVGGKRDETDISSADVALREAFEEVGLNRKDCEILGYLPMQISKKGLLVRPVVACVRADVADSLTPNQDEIARLFWLPFDVLRSPPVDYVFDRSFADKSTKLHTPAWVYDCDDDGTPEIVWGLTGRILANLLEIGFGIKWTWYYRLG